jgi:hypothetical protein
MRGSNPPTSYRMYDDLAQQTYVYTARHSMRDPMYVSVSDPVYDVDRSVSSPTRSSSSQGLKMMDDYAQQTYVYSAARHSMRDPKYVSISEPAYDINSTTKKENKQPQHPYRMVDDYAQQTYVYSATRHSMKEPHYVSISEPAYDLGKTHAPKKPATPATSRPAARMFDEYAQQTYVYSMSRHSMKDPVYVSISDPVYEVDKN